MVRALLVATCVGSSVLVSGCATESCTAIGCQNQASFTVRAPDDTWAAGTYMLGVSFDGVATTACHFSMPPLPATQGSLVPLDCSPVPPAGSFQAYLEQVTTCTTTDNGNESSQSCTPVAGRYSLSVTTTTMPASVGVTLALGGADPYFDDTKSFAYSVAQPNGA